MSGQLSERKSIEIDISPKRPTISIELGAPHSGTDHPVYNGPTIVMPEPYDIQILPTKEKIVKENIMVLPIPYYETSNPQGGITAYIGE